MTTALSATTGVFDRLANPLREGRDIDATLVDAAILANRRNTPQAAIDKRTAPRYSIGELNSMDWSAVQERFDRLPKPDTRPGIVRFLDIIDLPRNAIANAVTAVAMPRAREAAIARGDFDDTGLPKVWGSDILRGLGLKNKIVNGAVGFGLDIFMDPLSWVGGPIGGLKTAGAQGTRVALGKTAEKSLRGALSAVGKGRAVENATIRELFEATAKKRGIDLTKGAEAEDALSRALLGDVGGFARDLGTKVGLGVKGSGGDLAGLYGRSADMAGDAAEAAQIKAVGKFIDEFTLNRGVKLGKSPGTALAHVPLTDLTLYGPAFTRGGHDAVMQRAIALATTGKQVGASFMSDVAQTVNKAESLWKEAEKLSDAERTAAEMERVARARGDEDTAFWAGFTRAELASRANAAKVQAKATVDESVKLRQAAQSGDAGLSAPENLGDLIATAEYAKRAFVQAEKTDAERAWRDAERLIPRTTEADVGAAKSVRTAIARAAGADPQTIADDLAPAATRRAEFDRMVEIQRAREDDRLGDIVREADHELDTMATVAEAFNAYAATAWEHAMLSKTPLEAALNSSDRMLAKASARLLGIDDQVAGGMRLAPISKVFDYIGGGDSARMAAVARSATEAFGNPDSAITRTINRQIAAARGFHGDLADTLVQQYKRGGGPISKGIYRIAKDHGIKGYDLDKLDKLVSIVGIAKHDDLHTGYWQTLVDGTDTALARAVKSLATDGWLQNKALMEDVTRLADEIGELWKGDAQHALRERQLNFTLVGGGYFPLVSTPEWTQYFRRLESAGGAKREAALAAKENFQKGRELVEVRFKDGDGNWRKYLELERTVYESLTPAEVEQLKILHPEAAKELEAKIETFKLFDKLNPGVDKLGRVRVFGRALDPFELNEQVGSGIFRMIAGGPTVGDDIFETSAAHAIARRASGGAVADAKQALVEGVLRPFILPIETKLAAGQVYTPGQAVKLADGSVAHALGDGRLKVSNKYGSTVYRQLETIPLGQGEPIFRMKDLLAESGIYSDFVPEAIAEQVLRLERALRPRHMGFAMRNADTVTKLWRASTLLHPSWMVVNAIGNSILYSMAYPDTVVKRTPAFLKFATKALLARNNPEKLAGISIKLYGQKVSAADLLRIGGAERVTGGGYHAEAIEHLFNEMRPKSLGEAKEAIGRRIREDVAQSFKESMAASAAANAPDYMKRGRAGLKAAASVASGPFKSAVHAWFRANGMIDDTFRLAAFMAELDRGSDAVQAAAGVRNAMLNFGDLTTFEAEKLRPWLPFYSWTRASLPNMLAKLTDEPRYFGMVPKMQQAIEEMNAGEAKVPRHMRPRWLQEQIGIQVGTDDETRKIVTIGTMLPQEGAIRTVTGLLGTAGQFLPGRQEFDGQDFMDYLDWWLGQTNPLAKLFVDLGTQRESFTGRTIGATSMEGDISLGEHLWNQIRVAREFGVGSTRQGALLKSFDEGLSTGLSRLMIGGRLQPFDEERRGFGLTRDMRKKEESVRRAIRIAQREGNEEAERNARVMLLQVYREHLMAGGNESDVPRWAIGQLEELAR